MVKTLGGKPEGQAPALPQLGHLARLLTLSASEYYIIAAPTLWPQIVKK